MKGNVMRELMASCMRSGVALNPGTNMGINQGIASSIMMTTTIRVTKSTARDFFGKMYWHLFYLYQHIFPANIGMNAKLEASVSLTALCKLGSLIATRGHLQWVLRL